MAYKMIILMRKDLNMRKGKMIAQGAHAATMPFITDNIVNSERFNKWFTEDHMTKICLGVDSLNELLDIKTKAMELGLETNTITDAGFTEFKGVPTITCMAIGPNLVNEIDLVTSHLKLL